MASLEGKVALVTGAGRNIGRATVLALARAGADVVVNARSNQAEIDAVAEEARGLGVRAIAITADVADAQQVEAMAAAALAEFGKVDILINNASVRPHRAFTDLDLAEWRNTLSVILDGSFLCTRALIDSMIANSFGRIVFITGEGAYGTGYAFPNAAPAAAKMGVVGLAHSLAREYAEHNILVNIVSPGSIDTTRPHLDWYMGFRPNADGIPLGRQGTSAEIAAACLFFVTDESSFITGQTLHVNGGAAVN